MKPVAPVLYPDEAVEQPTLESEIGRLCEAKANDGRATVPSPPSMEALLASTPFPPPPPVPGDEAAVATATMPAPPASLVREVTEPDPDEEAVASTIPRPPRVPRIAGV